MPDRYIDPAPHTMLAASVIAIVNTGCLETVKYGYYGNTVIFLRFHCHILSSAARIPCSLDAS